MIHHLREVLPRDVCQEILTALADAQFVDGLASAQSVDQSVKKNLQLPVRSPRAPEIAKRIGKHLAEHQAFADASFPRAILPPRISKYREGMYYEAHLDAVTMRSPHGPIRTDLSATICLNDSSAYEGGELCIQAEDGEHVFKGAQGDVILYPSSYIHEVKAVTGGERIVALSWIESKVRDIQQRRILQDMLESLRELEQAGNLERPLLLKLKRCHGQLLRMWMDS